MDIPETMRRWQYTSTKGSLESNLTLDVVPMLQPQANQYLVRIIAAAINPVDYRLAEVQLLHRLFFPNPASPGDDFAGYIVKAAPGSSLKPGQLVFGAVGTNFMCGGAMSEYGVVDAKAITTIPAGISTTDAAGITIAGITAYQSILPYSKPGSRVFINGGSGGVGTFGIQIAKIAGRHVTVSCSTANVKLCESLGAEEVIDYKKQNVLQTLKLSSKKYDLVVDLVGNDENLYWKAHEYTSSEAKFVTVAVSHRLSFLRFVTKANLLPSFLGGAKRQHILVFGKTSAEDLKQIAEWMAEGKIKPVTNSKFDFEDLKQAYERAKTGRAKGKIIINVAPMEECTA
jgi:NADPH:quinone reductase-like Zn-dependent oxidoreductase